MPKLGVRTGSVDYWAFRDRMEGRRAGASVSIDNVRSGEGVTAFLAEMVDDQKPPEISLEAQRESEQIAHTDDARQMRRDMGDFLDDDF